MHSRENWEEIEESTLNQCAQQVSLTENENNFVSILDAGRIYKEAGLTPIYIYDKIRGELGVYAEELLDRKLN